MRICFKDFKDFTDCDSFEEVWSNTDREKAVRLHFKRISVIPEKKHVFEIFGKNRVFDKKSRISGISRNLYSILWISWFSENETFLQ